jgi:beta-N-acetylglucosaminidase
VEQYNLLSEDDSRGKDVILSDLASKYGLSITGLTAEDKDALYDAIVEITEGKYSGVQEIFEFIQKQQGLSIEKINEILINGGTLEDDGAENSFIQMLKNLGLIEETLVEGKT